MRKLYLFLLPVLFLFSCNNSNVENIAIVNGKIIDPTNEYVTVTINEKKDTAKIQEDGSFSIKIDLEKPSYGIIQTGEYSDLFLSPGDSIYVELDAKEFDKSITYSGIGAEINNYLASKILFKSEITIPQNEFYSLNEEIFIQKVDSLEHLLIDEYSKLSVNNKVFNTLEPKNIEYLSATMLMRYPRYHEYYAKNEDYEKSDSLWSFLENIEIENSDYWGLKSYRDFFNVYYSTQVTEIMNSDEEFEKKSSQNAYTYAQFNFIKSKLTDPELKSKKAGDAMYEQVMYYTTDSIDDLMTDFLALCTDTVKINEVNSIIEKKKKIAKGMPAPNFETVDAENNPVSLTDFKGKYVYIDFWASWCGPCKREIPYFKSLSSEFEGENIAFLSVSVDAKKEDWEKALETHDMTGNLLYIGSSDIIRNAYMVRSIPRFVLIDTEGNFISSNAPRPSSDEIKNVLNGLI